MWPLTLRAAQVGPVTKFLQGTLATLALVNLQLQPQVPGKMWPLTLRAAQVGPVTKFLQGTLATLALVNLQLQPQVPGKMWPLTLRAAQVGPVTKFLQGTLATLALVNLQLQPQVPGKMWPLTLRAAQVGPVTKFLQGTLATLALVNLQLQPQVPGKMWPLTLRAAQVGPVTKFLQGTLATLALVNLQLQPQVPDGAVYDFIVVGAGTAGSIVATRLAADPARRVLLLEAGGPAPRQSEIPGLFPLLAQSEYDWNYEAYTALNVLRAQKGKLKLVRGKMLGGCSSANYMVHVLGCREDYDGWAAAAGPEWSWANMSKHIKKIEAVQDQDILSSRYGNLRGTDGEIKITRQVHRDYTLKYFHSFFEMGHKISHDYNSNPEPTFSEGQYTISGGERQSTAATYLKTRRPNLDILTHTRVSRVIFDENKNAVGVEAFSKDGTRLTFKARKEVILSAGAINTPQILMLSGIGPQKHLEQFDISVISDLPVGENLQDHILVPILLTSDNVTEPDPTTIFEFPAPTIVGFAALNKTQTQPDYELLSYAMVRGSKQPLLLCHGFGVRDEICDRFDDAAAANATLLTNVVLLHPASRGRVRLHSPDPAQPPSIYMGYYDKPEDLERHVSYVEDFLRVLNTTYFKKVGSEVVNVNLEECAFEEFGSHDYWRCYARHMAASLYHPAGTAALGAVLDARLRVRGAGRLRVADASALPALPSGNTNAPVALLAENAAHLIKQDYAIRN